ncbi:hypothetical protein PTKIN_Ptkin05aG0162000 [Pterospermum kingtungense]
MSDRNKVSVKGNREEEVGICKEIEGLKLKGEVGNKVLDDQVVDKSQCSVIVEESGRIDFCADRNSDREVLLRAIDKDSGDDERFKNIGNFDSILESGALVTVWDKGDPVDCEGVNILDGIVNILKENGHKGEKNQGEVDGVVLSSLSVVEWEKLIALREGIEAQECPYFVELPPKENSDLVVDKELKQKLDKGGKFRMVNEAIGEGVAFMDISSMDRLVVYNRRNSKKEGKFKKSVWMSIKGVGLVNSLNLVDVPVGFDNKLMKGAGGWPNAATPKSYDNHSLELSRLRIIFDSSNSSFFEEKI